MVLVHRLLRLTTAAAFAATLPLHAQETDNIAPRISLTGISEAVRADTLCVDLQAGAMLGFADLSVIDPDVATGDLRVRVELEPANADLGMPSVSIPGLATLAGVAIIAEDPDRIRFTAPLDSVNAALAALQYQSDQPGVDLIDIIVDDQQLPPLSTEFRLYLDVQSMTTFDVARCRPPPDLQPGSDTGASQDDDITVAPVLVFDITGLTAGDSVQLLNDEILLDSGTATGSSMTLSDPAPVVGTTGLYSVVVNADLGSAAWSVAIVPPTIFAHGFEDIVVP